MYTQRQTEKKKGSERVKERENESESERKKNVIRIDMRGCDFHGCRRR